MLSGSEREIWQDTAVTASRSSVRLFRNPGDTFHSLAQRHDITRTLIRIWVGKYEAGGLDEDVASAALITEARIAALERLVGKQALELKFLKGALKALRGREAALRPSSPAPWCLSVAKGCRLMGMARSSFYDRPERPADDTAIVEAMVSICDEFEFYGYRRVGAALRQQGVVVNHKKIRRLMVEYDLQPRMRRRFVATTDSNHDSPIFPNLAKDVVPMGSNQLWMADITYVALPARFVYVAVVLDAWSCMIVGYAIGRSIDARLTMAALSAAVERRMPPPGCVHRSDRGLPVCRRGLPAASRQPWSGGLDGPQGNPYDNAKAESFMKTLKVEAIYPMVLETLEEVAAHLPHFIDEVYNKAGSIRRWDISAQSSSRINTSGTLANQRPDLCPPAGAHSIRRFAHASIADHPLCFMSLAAAIIWSR